MALLILDPMREQEFRKTYLRDEDERYLETWNGVDVLLPFTNDNHQHVVGVSIAALGTMIRMPRLGHVFPGVNITDRHPDWTQNYRGPDVVVYLNSNTAINYGTHWLGGPDFLAEIISPGEDRLAKVPFYASINTGEILIVDRDPWQLELLRIQNQTPSSVGISTLTQPQVLVATSIGFSFQLVGQMPRPNIEMIHVASGQRWIA